MQSSHSKEQSRVIFQCERNYKNSWVNAAQKSNSKLSAWLIEAANEKLAREFHEIVEKFSNQEPVKS